MGQTEPWIKAHQRVLPGGEELGQDGGGSALDWSQLFGVIELALALSLWVHWAPERETAVSQALGLPSVPAWLCSPTSAQSCPFRSPHPERPPAAPAPPPHLSSAAKVV